MFPNKESSVFAIESSSKATIILNRPKVLNGINLEMVRKIHKYLKRCENSKSLMIIKGSGDKAFCAGGNIQTLIKASSTFDDSKNFLREEYTTNALIANYKIPYIAIIDGITMGDGFGLSVHGKYRLATERTRFAMPEASIGLFPDAGASYFLPRLQGKLGLYLGLTGYRLIGEDVFKAGIATHYCASSQVGKLEAAFLNSSPDAHDVVDLLDKFHAPTDRPFELQPVLEQIDKCFSADSVEGIIDKLKKDGSEWANRTLETLDEKSPTSLKVTFRQVELGAHLSLPQCLSMEFRLAVHLLQINGFKESVRAIIVNTNKEQKPQWQPPTLASVSDEFVQSLFAELTDTEELKL